MRQRRKPRAAQLGITDADYEALLAAQGGGCAICGNPPKTRRLHVDHDHKTGKVRGLLCHRCNRALPNWVTVEWLYAAMTYLAPDAWLIAPGPDGPTVIQREEVTQ
jgi:Recombination endonuclease VII